MVELKNEFKEFCISSFKEEGEFIYKTYKGLKFPNTRPEHKFMLLTERRKKNIEYFIKQYGVDKFLQGARYYAMQLDKGLIKTNTINYFTSVVENYIVKENKPPTYISNTLMPIPEKEKIIPIKEVRVRTEYEDEFFNWDYKCKCGTIIDPWTQECPKCKAYFLWEHVTL